LSGAANGSFRRHSFATDLLEVDCDTRTILELLGLRDFGRTTIHAQVWSKGDNGKRSLVDGLCSGIYNLYKPELPKERRSVIVRNDKY
jgi:hypothetical protein